MDKNTIFLPFRPFLPVELVLDAGGGTKLKFDKRGGGHLLGVFNREGGGGERGGPQLEFWCVVRVVVVVVWEDDDVDRGRPQVVFFVLVILELLVLVLFLVDDFPGAQEFAMESPKLGKSTLGLSVLRTMALRKLTSLLLLFDNGVGLVLVIAAAAAILLLLPPPNLGPKLSSFTFVSVSSGGGSMKELV